MIKNNKALIEQLRKEGIQNKWVLAAMAAVDRQLYVDSDYRDMAYENHPLPIACQQTISQPFIVAQMVALAIENGKQGRVLEIGTGSVYQAAILAQLYEQVYTIERIEDLYQQAEARILQYELDNISILYGDGFKGWPEYAPYDAIIVTAAAPEIPSALLAQLVDGGCLVIPIEYPGEGQALIVVIKQGDQFKYISIEPVAFVPMLSGVLNRR